MKLTYALIAAAGLSLAGCGSDGSPASGGAEAAAPDRVATTPAASSKVEKAASVARAIEASPDNSAEILRQNGMTVEQFEDLMYEIAADPKMSAEYNARVGR